MPVLNEEDHLIDAVGAVLAQDFDGELEVVLALGPSTDDTDNVAKEIASRDVRVRLVSNPSGRTPAALNVALSVAQYGVVVRVDAHSELPPNYLQVALETLQRTGADNVGGVMNAVGVTDVEQAIAIAMKSKLGVGGASFHVGGEEGEALTVYLGAFRAETLRKVGGYDEHFDRAQDWELNHRIRQAGGTVWFNPEMAVTYRPRRNFKALASQYFQYGQWRREVMRTYPSTVSARYLAPPILVAGLGGGIALVFAGIASRSRKATLLGLAAPAGYAALVTLGGLVISRGAEPAVRRKVPVALATMHLAWGSGFLTSRNQRQRRSAS